MKLEKITQHTQAPREDDAGQTKQQEKREREREREKPAGAGTRAVRVSGEHGLPRVSLQCRMRVFQVLLHFFPSVKYGTIVVRAQHVLVKTALAPLALRPQSREMVLNAVDILEVFPVQVHRIILAILA